MCTLSQFIINFYHLQIKFYKPNLVFSQVKWVKMKKDDEIEDAFDMDSISLGKFASYESIDQNG